MPPVRNLRNHHNLFIPHVYENLRKFCLPPRGAGNFPRKKPFTYYLTLHAIRHASFPMPCFLFHPVFLNRQKSLIKFTTLFPPRRHSLAVRFTIRQPGARTPHHE